MINYFIFYLFIVNIIIITQEKSLPLILPFSTRFNKENMNKSNVIQMFINNNIIVNIEVGSNGQKIEMNIKNQKHSSFILSKSSHYHKKAMKFDENSTDTYKKLNNETKYYMYEFEYGIYSEDTFILPLENKINLRVERFPFILAKTMWYDYQNYMGGCFGLSFISKTDDPTKTELIGQLHEKSLIKSTVFMLDYKDNFNGVFVMGNYLHEYNESYKKSECLFMKAQRSSWKYPEWIINIDKVENKKEEAIIQKNTYIYLYYELGVLCAPKNYYIYINSTFFHKYKEEGICTEKNDKDPVASFNKYYYIECNKKGFNKESFPDLEFYNSETNYTFSFNYKDLFYEFEDKIYFLVIFPFLQTYTEYWYVGKPFFMKYKLFLDRDKKTIGFYPDNGKQPEKPSNNAKIIILVVVIVLLVVILAGVLYYFLWVKKSRKQRANELDDDVDYIPHEDQTNNQNENEGVN